MKRTRSVVGGATAIAIVVATTAMPARAQGTADEAAAVALFNEAKKLVGAGNYAAACPKFVEVRRVMPTPGLFLNLGDCYEHLGKMASAWGAFKEAERIAGAARDADRLGEAGRRAKVIEGQLSRLTITVGTAERLPGLQIKRDDGVIGEGQWGSAVPVDAGEHVIEVSASGHRSWLTTITVPPNGAAISVAVPRLVPDPVLVAPPEEPGSWWTGQRIAGASVGGVGVVGLVMGAIFGGRRSRRSRSPRRTARRAIPTFATTSA
ncbi:Hypothetical protein A7982_11477 [Minicystis rosea]|nr:Hypothetical protein A7982_11477 [Minicystis rosea]